MEEKLFFIAPCICGSFSTLAARTWMGSFGYAQDDYIIYAIPTDFLVRQDTSSAKHISNAEGVYRVPKGHIEPMQSAHNSLFPQFIIDIFRSLVL